MTRTLNTHQYYVRVDVVDPIDWVKETFNVYRARDFERALYWAPILSKRVAAQGYELPQGIVRSGTTLTIG